MTTRNMQVKIIYYVLQSSRVQRCIYYRLIFKTPYLCNWFFPIGLEYWWNFIIINKKKHASSRIISMKIESKMSETCLDRKLKCACYTCIMYGNNAKFILTAQVYLCDRLFNFEWPKFFKNQIPNITIFYFITRFR